MLQNLLIISICRAVTEQLRREAAIQRIPVSQAVNEFMKYVNEHEQEDCLLVVGVDMNFLYTNN